MSQRSPTSAHHKAGATEMRQHLTKYMFKEYFTNWLTPDFHQMQIRSNAAPLRQFCVSSSHKTAFFLTGYSSYKPNHKPKKTLLFPTRRELTTTDFFQKTLIFSFCVRKKKRLKTCVWSWRRVCRLHVPFLLHQVDCYHQRPHIIEKFTLPMSILTIITL